MVASYSAKFAAGGAFFGSLVFGKKGAVAGAALGGLVGNNVGQFKATREEAKLDGETDDEEESVRSLNNVL